MRLDVTGPRMRVTGYAEPPTGLKKETGKP